MINKCNICLKNNAVFSSIENSLGNQLKTAQFPYRLSDFETLNYKKYSCSNCGSSDRDRLYALYLNKYWKYKKLKIIDFAPSQALSSYLSRNDSFTCRTADLYMDGVDDKVDITNMSIYKDNLFNFFICSHILEHVADDKKALKELHRILKPNGSGILMTPIIVEGNVFDEDINVLSDNEKRRRFAQDDHVRLYSKKVFLERVKSAGFSVSEYTYKDFGILNFYRYAIARKSVLYIVTKK